jgi:hypothetical protein
LQIGFVTNLREWEKANSPTRETEIELELEGQIERKRGREGERERERNFLNSSASERVVSRNKRTFVYTPCEFRF